jgi:hypothetical protein
MCQLFREMGVEEEEQPVVYHVHFHNGTLDPNAAAIVASYGNILRSVRNWKAEMMSCKTETNPQPMAQLLHSPAQKKASRQSDAAEKRSTVMVAVMIAALLIAWTPYSILALIETFTGGNDGNSSPVSWPRRRLFSIPSFMAFLILRYTVRISTVKSIN